MLGNIPNNNYPIPNIEVRKKFIPLETRSFLPKKEKKKEVSIRGNHRHRAIVPVSPFAFRVGGSITRKTIALLSAHCSPLFERENAEHGGNRISRRDATDCARSSSSLPARPTAPNVARNLNRAGSRLGQRTNGDKNAIIRDNGLIRGIKNRKQIIRAYTFSPRYSFPSSRGTPLNRERRPLK